MLILFLLLCFPHVDNGVLNYYDMVAIDQVGDVQVEAVEHGRAGDEEEPMVPSSETRVSSGFLQIRSSSCPLMMSNVYS
jgi:hypothetical protein